MDFTLINNLYEKHSDLNVFFISTLLLVFLFLVFTISFAFFLNTKKIGKFTFFGIEDDYVIVMIISFFQSMMFIMFIELFFSENKKIEAICLLFFVSFFLIMQTLKIFKDLRENVNLSKYGTAFMLIVVSFVIFFPLAQVSVFYEKNKTINELSLKMENEEKTFDQKISSYIKENNIEPIEEFNIGGKQITEHGLELKTIVANDKIETEKSMLIGYNKNLPSNTLYKVESKWFETLEDSGFGFTTYSFFLSDLDYYYNIEIE